MLKFTYLKLDRQDWQYNMVSPETSWTLIQTLALHQFIHLKGRRMNQAPSKGVFEVSETPPF